MASAAALLPPFGRPRGLGVASRQVKALVETGDDTIDEEAEGEDDLEDDADDKGSDRRLPMIKPYEESTK
ncbi:hypothetical protein BGX23_008331 [Mortierella sp. AD031]|nr:hypothetical protein BGX23_008331 [Mortierella sp. AD031]